MPSIEHLRTSWTPGTFPHIREWVERKPARALFKGLAGSADAFLIADLFLTTNRPILVCVENAKKAEMLAEECKSFTSDDAVCLFPSRDAVPYNMKSPFGPTTEARLTALSRLLAGGRQIYIAPAAALLQKVPAPRTLFKRIIRLQAGVDVSLDQLKMWLAEAGFRRETQVTDIGTFSVRGDILDIYPFMTEYPLRCEFWGDTLESIREFDVFSQKSQGTRQDAEIYPMRELLLEAGQIDAGIERIKAHCTSTGADLAVAYKLEHQWKSSGDTEGIEWFLHWFDSGCGSVLDYCADSTILVWDDLLSPQRRFDDGRQNYLRHLERVPPPLRPFVSAPGDLLVSIADLEEGMSLLPTVYADTMADIDGAAVLHCSFAEQPAFSQSVEVLVKDLADHHGRGFDVLMLSGNLGHAERLAEILDESAPFVKPRIGALYKGFIDRENRRVVYTDKLLFPHQVRPPRIKKTKSAEAVAHFDELSPGDFVVHDEHGIAKFVGIERISVAGSHRDCMVLQYAERGRLYVPVEDFHRVQKYVGKDSATPVLSTLGTAAWERIKARTRESLKEMASELIELYAKRQYLKGIAFPPDATWQKEFEDAFMYDETPDQLRAIKEVKADMESEKPMDRLVCGDVGFGKTEVAMRAAFKAVMAGYQVAVLAPTTILAAQHFAVFSERMASFPVKIGVLSRFLKPREQKDVITEVNAGNINILIGTHRMLSEDVKFSKLGMLIIDEEQRFGVKHKERIKQVRFDIDVLSLTATPIPRTLHMSLVGARDLSIINTPPRNRLPIETTVAEYHDELVKNALEEELDRGGQVYVVDNRIKHLDVLHEKIEELVPRAKIITGHGQMDEGQLELVMKEFIAGRYDVLLATTIIENGLDISNVNTIIVNRADLMGLSQLYQLRGRVGRSSEQAYAYFLTPAGKGVTEDSLKRLRALEQYTELGSGFQIAMRDLEIRGAGNILGTSQHGFISAVGFELYCRLLKETIDEVQGKVPVKKAPETKVDVACEAFIPTEYVADAPARVAIYQQLSGVEVEGEIDEAGRSMADRFGPIPPAVVTLLTLMKIRLAGRTLGCATVSISAEGALSLQWEGSADDVKKSIEPVLKKSKYPFEVSVDKVTRLKTTLSAKTALDRIEETLDLLQNLTGK